jgi:hypothetical protein
MAFYSVFGQKKCLKKSLELTNTYYGNDRETDSKKKVYFRVQKWP